MSEQNRKQIIDASGKILNHSVKKEKIKNIVMDNLWNILGTGIGACIIFMNLISIFSSREYANSCSLYYGISRNYFDGSELFKDKVMFFVLVCILVVYPLLFYYLNLKAKSKIFVGCSFVITVIVLFEQNIMYTDAFLDRVQCERVKRIIDNYTTVVIFFIADVVISYFLIIRMYFLKEKSFKRFQKILLVVALFLYLVDTAIGSSIVLNSGINDKRAYEIINEEKVIVSLYDGKFLTMDCEIQGSALYIKKGKYYFTEMTDVDITYREFEEVICE